MDKAAVREPQLEQLEEAAERKREQAAEVQAARESLAAALEAEARWKALTGPDAPVAVQLAHQVAQRSLKLADVVAKWGDVDRPAFRAHLAELGVAASEAAVDACFASLDEGGRGTVAEADMKGRMRRLLDAAKGSSTDEAQLEKAALGARKAASAMQVAIVAAEKARAEEARMVAEADAAREQERTAAAAAAAAAEAERLEREQAEERARRADEKEKAHAASPFAPSRRGGADAPSKRGASPGGGLLSKGASGGASPFAPAGVHAFFTCDRSGVCPIVGFRYHLRSEDYDLCQAEYDKLPPSEKSQYDAIPPPAANS